MENAAGYNPGPVASPTACLNCAYYI